MSEDRAWAAGLFEGEGTVTISGGRHRLAVRMVDEDAVRRFGAIVEAGKVYGPYGPYVSSIGMQPTFMWVAQGAAADIVGVLLWPWLGARVRSLIEERFGASTTRIEEGVIT